MGKRIRKLKKQRIHNEGIHTLLGGFLFITAVAILLWVLFDTKIPFWTFIGIFGLVYAVVVNFFRCPIRHFGSDDVEKIVVAPAELVKHFDGNFHKAWLPKASEENEHADVLIETPEGETILCRQIAGAMARRIVTYAREGEDCYIDEHMGFIKFGSRVDVYLPLGTEVCVKMGQSTTGDQTIIAKLP